MTHEFTQGDAAMNERSAKETVEGIKENTKQQGKEYLDQGKGAASEVLLDFADALESAAGELKEKNRGTSAEYMRAASGTMRDFSTSLNAQSSEELLYQVKRVVRRQPALLLGGAALVGFALTRFLKVADHDEDHTHGGHRRMHQSEGRTTVPPGTRHTTPSDADIHPAAERTTAQPVADPADPADPLSAGPGPSDMSAKHKAPRKEDNTTGVIPGKLS